MGYVYYFYSFYYAGFWLSEVGGLPLEEKVEEIRKGFNVEINKWIGACM